jgi:hypothetical protein
VARKGLEAFYSFPLTKGLALSDLFGKERRRGGSPKGSKECKSVCLEMVAICPDHILPKIFCKKGEGGGELISG